MEMIKIQQNSDGNQAVSARELHTFLAATERFQNWFERQMQYGFSENVDFVGCKVFNTQAKQELQDYALTLDCAKEISMLQKSEKGKEARLYFIGIEKAYRMLTPVGYKDALRALIAKEEEKERLQLEIGNLAPKAAYHDRVLQSSSLITTTVIAADLGMSAVKLNKILQDNQVIYKQGKTWILYAKYQGKEYTHSKTHTYTKLDGTVGTEIHTYWTEKGRNFIYDFCQ